jgi:hypothetical protein
MKTGEGFLAIWSDVRPEQETDYLHWLTREHTEERVSIPGFLGVRVFRSRSTGNPRYFILYALESAAALASPAYLARLNAPSPWSQRIMPILGNFRRGGGTVVVRQGMGAGAVVAPILPDGPDSADAGRLDAIATRDRIAAVSLLAVDGAGTAIQTSEKTLRSGDRTFDALLLVEALDAESLAAAIGDGHEVFDQVFALDKAALTA